MVRPIMGAGQPIPFTAGTALFTRLSMARDDEASFAEFWVCCARQILVGSPYPPVGHFLFAMKRA